MSDPTPIGEDDLQAFIDGRLAADRLAAVEAWLADHPQRARDIGQERAQREALRAALAMKAAEPIPARLRIASIRASRRSRLSLALRNLAAGLALVALGAGGGWLARGDTQSVPAPATQVTRDAVAAHRIFAVEVAHPVEVTAREEAHLLRWLSKRLGRQLAAPDLAEFGFHLVGGRLLPAEADAAAQLMYENEGGQRLTVYVRAGAPGETAFRFWQDGAVASFVWLDQGYGFAVSAEAGRDQLLPIAEAVYTVLDGKAANAGDTKS